MTQAENTERFMLHHGRLWCALIFGFVILFVLIWLNIQPVSGGRFGLVTLGFPFVYVQRSLSTWSTVPYTPEPLPIQLNVLYALLLIFLLGLWCFWAPAESSGVQSESDAPPKVLHLVLASQLMVVFGTYFSRSYEFLGYFLFLPFVCVIIAWGAASEFRRTKSMPKRRRRLWILILISILFLAACLIFDELNRFAFERERKYLPFLAICLAKFIFLILIFVFRYRSPWIPVLLLTLFVIFVATFRPAFEVVDLWEWRQKYDIFKMSLVFAGQFVICLFVFRFWGLTFQHQLNEGPRVFKLSEAFFLTSIIAVLFASVSLIEFLHSSYSTEMNQAKFGSIAHALILSTSVLLIVHEWVIRGRVWLAFLLAECLVIFGCAFAYKLDPEINIWRPRWHLSLVYPLSVIGGLWLLEYFNLRLVITRWGKNERPIQIETKTTGPLESDDPWDD